MNDSIIPVSLGYKRRLLLIPFQSLDPNLESQLGEINKTAPKYSIWTKLKVISCKSVDSLKSLCPD